MNKIPTMIDKLLENRGINSQIKHVVEGLPKRKEVQPLIKTIENPLMIYSFVNIATIKDKEKEIIIQKHTDFNGEVPPENYFYASINVITENGTKEYKYKRMEDEEYAIIFNYNKNGEREELKIPNTLKLKELMNKDMLMQMNKLLEELIGDIFNQNQINPPKRTEVKSNNI